MKKGIKMSADLPPGDSHISLDPGIRSAVLILRDGGVETFESCEGGVGHSFPEPTVRFHGDSTAGYHAFAVARQNGLPVKAVRRVHDVIEGQLHGPWWELVLKSS